MTPTSWRIPPEERQRALRFLTGGLTGGALPPAIRASGGGGKFAPDGAVLPWPGNTFICHVDPSGVFHAALCAVQDRIAAAPEAVSFAFLPRPSLHMTVFGGVGGHPLDADGWPEDLPPRLSRDEVSRLLERRLEALACPGSFAVRPRSIRPGAVSMAGADPAAERALRATRDRLRDATGLRRPGHDGYEFHVSLGYLLRWMPAEAAEALLSLSERAFADHLIGFDRVELGPIEFCDFDTMHAFRPRGTLAPDGYRAERPAAGHPAKP